MRSALALPLCALVAAGCSGGAAPAPAPGADDLSHGDAFVAITRPLDGPAARIRAQSVPATDAPSAFYLAIHKPELGQRYFLSAYIKQYSPGEINTTAALGIGTRVV